MGEGMTEHCLKGTVSNREGRDRADLLQQIRRSPQKGQLTPLA